MIIIPKVRGFICTTSHPAGCAANIQDQIDYVKKNFAFLNNKDNYRVLVIGASTGYGLASRIVSSFGLKAATIGVFFEREALAEKTASPGWYNSVAFEVAANKAGIYAKSINGDAFANETKLQTVELIKQDLKQIDLIIYSLASPRRTVSNVVYNSVLKPIGKIFTSKTVDFNNGKISDIEIFPATSDEIDATIKVMGGEDVNLWIDYMHKHQVLANNCQLIAYSYIGPEITYPVYRNGTIGRAKEHLEATIKCLNKFLHEKYNGSALISVNKALVTQASAAIPVVPLYISLLYKVMKAKGMHEGCIEQISRLFKNYLINPNENKLNLIDELGRIRIDDLEMNAEIQAEVAKLWNIVNTDNLRQLSDLSGYQQDFYKLFGFNMEGVDYAKDYDINVAIPSLVEYA